MIRPGKFSVTDSRIRVKAFRKKAARRKWRRDADRTVGPNRDEISDFGRGAREKNHRGESEAPRQGGWVSVGENDGLLSKVVP